MANGDRDEPERAHIYVIGRVQGVFFRGTVQEEAEQLGLSGWVRNLHDGRVEALFEGPSKDVRRMVEWCGEGPPHSDVKNVETHFEEARGDLRGFEVR